MSAASPVKIGSFNMCKFSYQSDTEVRKNIEKIAEIIRGEDFDILAMQEVLNEAVIRDRLMCVLGSEWTYMWAQPVSKSVQAAEGFAYLWKKRKFRLATASKGPDDHAPVSKRIFAPRIYDGYSKDALLTNGRLIRDPFYIRLESVNGWYEIRLVNTHILFENAGAEALRLREFEKLVEIYCGVANKQYRSCRPSYTFLLGDYNLNLPRSGAKGPYLPETVEKSHGGRVVKRIVTRQDQLTTLKKPSPQAPDEPVQGFANNYDHFTYDALRFEGIQEPYCSRIDTVREYCGNDFALHRREVSDHIPICLRFSLT